MGMTVCVHVCVCVYCIAPSNLSGYLIFCVNENDHLPKFRVSF